MHFVYDDRPPGDLATAGNETKTKAAGKAICCKVCQKEKIKGEKKKREGEVVSFLTAGWRVLDLQGRYGIGNGS